MERAVWLNAGIHWEDRDMGRTYITRPGVFIPFDYEKENEGKMRELGEFLAKYNLLDDELDRWPWKNPFKHFSASRSIQKPKPLPPPPPRAEQPKLSFWESLRELWKDPEEIEGRHV